MKPLQIPLLLACILLSSTFLYSRPPGPGPGGGPGPFFGNIEMMQERFNLTDAQVQDIRSINESYRRKFDILHRHIHPYREQIREHLLEEEVDLEQVKRLLTEMAPLEVEMRMLTIKQRLEIEKVLSPAQKEAIKEDFMKRHHRRRRGHE